MWGIRIDMDIIEYVQKKLSIINAVIFIFLAFFFGPIRQLLGALSLYAASSVAYLSIRKRCYDAIAIYIDEAMDNEAIIEEIEESEGFVVSREFDYVSMFFTVYEVVIFLMLVRIFVLLAK